jgi:hypothetical protein
MNPEPVVDALCVLVFRFPFVRLRGAPSTGRSQLFQLREKDLVLNDEYYVRAIPCVGFGSLLP